MKWKTREKYRRQLREFDFQGLDGILIVDVAVILRRPYHEVYNAIHRLGIKHRFPAHGGEAMHISKRGYAHLAGEIRD